MASAAPVRISVACEFGAWQTRCEDIVETYDSEGAAISAAIECAYALGREGRFAFVVMRTLTSVYGPTGLIRTLPTRGRSTPQHQQQEDSLVLELIPALADPAPSIAAGAPEPIWSSIEEASQPVEEPDLAAKRVEQRPEAEGRITRIAAALAQEAENASTRKLARENLTWLGRSMRRRPMVRAR